MCIKSEVNLFSHTERDKYTIRKEKSNANAYRTRDASTGSKFSFESKLLNPNFLIEPDTTRNALEFVKVLKF